jgi:hypothetical protein
VADGGRRGRKLVWRICLRVEWILRGRGWARRHKPVGGIVLRREEMPFASLVSRKLRGSLLARQSRNPPGLSMSMPMPMPMPASCVQPAGSCEGLVPEPGCRTPFARCERPIKNLIAPRETSSNMVGRSRSGCRRMRNPEGERACPPSHTQ